MSKEQNGYSEGNYARAINAAATIVAGADTDDLDAKEVALNVLELAKELAKGQDKYFAKAGFTGRKVTSTSKPSGGSSKSSGGGTSDGGLTPKQRAAATKAIKSLGDDAPYTLEDIEAMSSDGGRDSERSTALGKLFDQAWG